MSLILDKKYVTWISMFKRFTKPIVAGNDMLLQNKMNITGQQGEVISRGRTFSSMAPSALWSNLPRGEIGSHPCEDLALLDGLGSQHGNIGGSCWIKSQYHLPEACCFFSPHPLIVFYLDWDFSFYYLNIFIC